MYKVMIVDDEPLVRAGLNVSVNWESLGYHVVSEAKDGKQALSFAVKNAPDIVFTDIRMPQMDGFAFIRQLKALLPDAVVVVLSGYDDYEYVRAAMKLGAYDYLLKLSLDAGSLTALLKDITLLLQQRRTLSQSPDTESDEDSGGNWAAVNPENCVVFFGIDAVEQLRKKLPGKDELRYENSIEAVIRQHLNDIGLDIQMARHSEWQWLALLGCERGLEHLTERVFGQINEALGLYFNISVSAGRSGIFGPESDIGSWKEEAYQVFQRNFFHDGGVFLRAGNIPAQNAADCYSAVSEQRLYSALDTRDREGVDRILHAIQKALRENQTADVRCARSVLREVLFTMLRTAKQCDIASAIATNVTWEDALRTAETLSDSIRVLQTLKDRIFTALEEKSREQGMQDVDVAKAYIHKNLAGNLTLSGIAGHVGMNESYFSALFSRRTGSVLTDYINQARIERAKLLLRTTDDKVCVIAQQVGYQNENYFSRVFRKHIGLSPNEYRKL